MRCYTVQAVSTHESESGLSVVELLCLMIFAILGLLFIVKVTSKESSESLLGGGWWVHAP